MNKKVSTIFAMAALMGGVFSGSAYAQLSTTAVANGEIAGKTVMLFEGSNVVGVLKDANGNSVSDIKTLGTIEKGKELNYTWKVTKVATNSIQPYNNMYVFANAVTGDTLAFDPAVPVDLFFPQKNGAGKMEYAIDKHYAFAFGQNAASFPTYSNPAQLYDAAQVIDGVTSVNVLTLAGTDPSLTTTPGAGFNLQTLDLIKVTHDELNALYNGKGFNLGAQKVNGISAEVEDNLFYGEDPIWAFTVNETYTDGGTTKEGYRITSEGGQGKDLILPNGTYFFSKPVFYNNLGSTDVNSASQINWLASTLIAVSPVEVSESTDANRAEGKGFKLVEVKGDAFIYIENTSEIEGNDVSINNACFIVESDHSSNADYPYALRLENFYYQKSAKYAGTDKQECKSIYLGVSSYDNSRQNVETKTGTAEHVFNLSASSVVDGITLLNDTKKAAIYAIKFVDGNKDDKDLMNKYLTVGSEVGQFVWEAKGTAIANLDYPIFQFVITAAEKDGGDAYVNVTFTNRETNESFTTQLFKADGENRYSLAINEENGTELNPGQNLYVQPYTVERNNNTYAVEKVTTGAVAIDSDITVELVKIEDVDRYAGFLNVDNETIRTLAFARDKNDTSNKVFSTVYTEYTGDPLDPFHYYLNEDDEFANDIADAAQWQLLRTNTATVSRVYVYNNTTTKSVDDVPNGDNVSAYVYALRYIENGTETSGFLTNSDDLTEYNNIEDAEDLESASYNDIKFIVKENVDGSVSLIPRSDAFVSGSKRVTSAGEAKAIEVNAATSGNKYEYIYNFNNRLSLNSDDVYASTSSARDVKTYLDPQKVEISWPANEGHVTLESELGNYINMNENRDAIVVNENDADSYYLYVTDKDAIVPSFYITKGIAAENGERMFLFNPTDSVNYYVADGSYDRKYQWAEKKNKAMFKAASINETRDTLTMDVKGETKYVAEDANDNNADIWGGLDRFKFQIIEAADEAEGYYYIRQPRANDWGSNYLSSMNDKMTWSSKDEAMLFTIESVAAPTANEGVSATEVKIIATDGAVNVKNAAGKNVVISTILGQIVANEVLTSDNATISVPAGIAIVSVDGEEAVKVSVK